MIHKAPRHMLRTSGWKWELVNPTEKVSTEQIRQKGLWKRKSKDGKVEEKERKEIIRSKIKEKVDNGRMVADKEQVAKKHNAVTENAKTMNARLRQKRKKEQEWKNRLTAVIIRYLLYINKRNYNSLKSYFSIDYPSLRLTNSHCL